MSMEHRSDIFAATPERIKLKPDASYAELEAAIPEIKALKGMAQKSDYHDLSLDEHSKRVTALLEQDPFIAALEPQQRDLVLLAAKFHDLGKNTEAGQQVHPKDPEKRQYIGHESVGEQIARELLHSYFDLPEAKSEFVSRLVALHAAPLGLMESFSHNKQPKGKELASYDKFISKVDAVPGDLGLNEKIKVLLAIAKADKLAAIDDASDAGSEKVAQIRSRLKGYLEVLQQLDAAMPALIKAVKAKRSGNQKAGIVLKDGEYRLI